MATIKAPVDRQKLLNTVSELQSVLLILSGAPKTPVREDVPESALELYDMMFQHGEYSTQKYTLLFCRNQFDDALMLASHWSRPIDQMMSYASLVDHPIRRQIVEIYIYYLNLFGDLIRIQPE